MGLRLGRINRKHVLSAFIASQVLVMAMAALLWTQLTRNELNDETLPQLPVDELTDIVDLPFHSPNSKNQSALSQTKGASIQANSAATQAMDFNDFIEQLEPIMSGPDPDRAARAKILLVIFTDLRGETAQWSASFHSALQAFNWKDITSLSDVDQRIANIDNFERNCIIFQSAIKAVPERISSALRERSLPDRIRYEKMIPYMDHLAAIIELPRGSLQECKKLLEAMKANSQRWPIHNRDHRFIFDDREAIYYYYNWKNTIIEKLRKKSEVFFAMKPLPAVTRPSFFSSESDDE